MSCVVWTITSGVPFKSSMAIQCKVKKERKLDVENSVQLDGGTDPRQSLLPQYVSSSVILMTFYADKMYNHNTKCVRLSSLIAGWIWQLKKQLWSKESQQRSQLWPHLCMFVNHLTGPRLFLLRITPAASRRAARWWPAHRRESHAG